MIRLSKNISLPDDAVTQTMGFVGRKGSGKTYISSRLCELFLQKNIQCIVLDPVGNWYGLRLDKTGKNPSKFNIPILGGEHGDVPLDYKSGEVVADFLLETGSSAVLDVSHFRKGQRKEFITFFAEQLFHQQKKRRIPLHLFIEEAQVFIPQRAGKGEERMLGAMEDIVRLGRNYGIGVSLNTQRPQSVNKEVLNQVEPLIVLQLVGSHERKAIQEWVSYSGADIKDQLSTLPELQTGDGFLWSPAWLRKFEPIRCTPKITFDASATPVLGNKFQQSVHLDERNIQELNDKMKAMVEKAEENDPGKLKKKIVTLERQLNLANKGVPESVVKRRISEAVKNAKTNVNDDSGEGIRLTATLQTIRDTADAALSKKKTARNVNREISTAPAVSSNANGSPIDSDLTGPQQRILDALAWWEATGINPPYSRVQVAFLARYKPTSGGFNNTISALKTLDLITYPSNGVVSLTDQGREKTNPVNTPTTQEELHATILNKLKGPQQRVLKPVLELYPDQTSRYELAQMSSYSEGSGGFNNTISSLKSLGLIEYPQNGYVKAVSILFI